MPAAKKASKSARKGAPKTARKSAKKAKLTQKQLAQRKYAASMKGVRARARKATGGKGLIKKRSTAASLRRKLGLSS